MPDLLKFINELTVNGKPVEEDELEDDYTSTEDDNQDDNDTDLDLTIGEEEPTTEDEEEPDDDYTVNTTDDNSNGTDSGEDSTTDDGNTEPTEDDEELNLTVKDDDSGSTTDDGNTQPLVNDTEKEEPNEDTEPANDNGLNIGGDDAGDAGDDDYTDTDDGDDISGDSTGDTSDDDLGDDTNNEEEPTEDEGLESKIKQTEAEIFNTLTAEEKAIRNKQLIDDFVTLKNVIKLFLEKVRTITLTEENTHILQFVEVSLVDLNNMVTDYIIERYSKKTYIENFVTYQQMVLTVQQIKEIISKININENPKK